jgi:hypothetical protein
MKTITYSLGCLALLATLISCSADELETTNNQQKAIISQTNNFTFSKDGDIDPPIPAPKPLDATTEKDGDIDPPIPAPKP